MVENKIIFNGKEYASPEAMPEEVRQAYQQALAHLADADRNGIPDILERGAAGNVIAIQQSSITINGREYKTVGDMPAVVRRLFELAVGQADANRNGIPDALESTLSGLETPSPAAGASRPEFSAAVNASTLKPPHGRTHHDGTRSNRSRARYLSPDIPRHHRGRHPGGRHFPHAQDGQRVSKSRRPFLCSDRRAHRSRRRGLAISETGNTAYAVQPDDDGGGKPLRHG